MTLDVFLQQLANGALLGSLFALLAIGYTMVYGILRLINFAHSNIFMMAMYFSFITISVIMIPWYLSFVLVILFTSILGMLTERGAYRPLRKRHAPQTSMLTSAIGVSFLLENLAIVLFSGRPKAHPEVPFFTDMVILGPVRLQRLALVVPVILVLLILLLLFIVNKTRAGFAMRAVARDPETAQLMGIDISRTITIVFAIGSALAAVGAIFWGMRYPQMTPTIGAMPGTKCFIAAVLGGIGNIKGAVLGGLLLGMLEVMLIAFLPSLTSYRDALAFLVLIVILLFLPQGLLGEKNTDKV